MNALVNFEGFVCIIKNVEHKFRNWEECKGYATGGNQEIPQNILLKKESEQKFYWVFSRN